MTVLSWSEVTREDTTSKEVSGFTFIGDDMRVFQVLFTADTDPVAMPIEAVDSPLLPQLWDTHPYDPFSYVTRKSNQYVGNLVQKVFVKYTRMENPLEQRPEFSWTFADVNEPIDKDKDNKPITNSAQEPFDPPIAEDYSDQVFRVVRNEATFDKLFAADFKNSVNIDTFLGFPPGTCWLKVFDGDEIKEAGLIYWRVSYEIHIRYDKDNEQASGWERNILDQGYRTIALDEAGEPKLTEDGKPTYEVMKDKDKNLLSQPVQLDGEGQKLSAGAVPVFLEFETKKVRQFSILGLE